MAKALVAVYFLTIVICYALGQEYVRGYRVNNNFQRGLTRAPIACTGNDPDPDEDDCTDPICPGNADRQKCICNDYFGPRCHSDCFTLLTCMGSAEPIESQCGSIDSTKPYCVGNSCTATKPTGGTCKKPTPAFTCTSKGQFPNPENCNEYFYCTDSNEVEQYVCPPKYVYDSKTGFCKANKTTADCQTIKCVKGAAPYQVFAADKSILIFCNPSDQKVILFRCTDPVNMEYNSATLQCEFICKAEGRFPDTTDPKSFYECYRDGTKFEYQKQTCPGNYIFSVADKICQAPPPSTP